MLKLFHLIPLALALSMSAAQADHHAASGTVTVLMRTEAGDIELALYPEKAPVTVANFLKYADGGHYKGASFYRTVRYENDNGDPKIEVIQGGIGDAEPPFPPIVHESTEQTGIGHANGVISMARGAVGTAAGEFFITIGDQPALDHGNTRNPDRQGFAAFGRVTNGMDTVRRIHQAPANEPVEDAYVKGQIIENPVKILSVERRE